MSIALPERGRLRNVKTRLHFPGQTNAIASEESDKHVILRDLTRFVEDSDLSIPRIAELLQVSDVTLSMWIAGTAKPSTIKLREIESLLQSRSSACARRFE
jgi:DNA-binding transcriptional regulator YiaG